MTAMLHCLVGDIADELRALLPNACARRRTTRAISRSIELLTALGLLDRAGPGARCCCAAPTKSGSPPARKARTGRREARVIQGLVSHGDGAVAAAAMALIIARGRRRDRFGQCLSAFR